MPAKLQGWDTVWDYVVINKGSRRRRSAVLLYGTRHRQCLHQIARFLLEQHFQRMPAKVPELELCWVSSGTLWDNGLTSMSMLMLIWLPSPPSETAFGNSASAALPSEAGLLWSRLLGVVLLKVLGRDEPFASRTAITSASLCC